MYDYLVVGAGLYGAVFAHEAKKHGKSVLVIDKTFQYRRKCLHRRYRKKFMYINTVHIFSIPIIVRYGSM